MPQELIKMGIQRCAPTAFDIALDGNVKIVKTKWYTDMPVLIPSFVNPKSAARLSDTALANKEQ
jgi:hypothetical protein